MRLITLGLNNFRNYVARSIPFSPGVTLIAGSNASGKTSIIEAINLLCTGTSFRAGKVDEMIRFDQEVGRVTGEVEVSGELVDSKAADPDADSEITELEVLLTRGIVQGKRTQHRLYSVNSVRRRRAVFMGNLVSVVFRPEDMRLVEGSPARRRDFIDTPLATLHQEYARSLTVYEQTLKRRNRLLEQVRDRETSPNTLHYWNQSLLKHGEIIQEQRRQFFASFVQVEFPMPFSVHYLPSVISAERMEEYAAREIAAGHTLIGPHKDDFEVELSRAIISRGESTSSATPTVFGATASSAADLVSVAKYGSRGQQRMAVLWLKVCERAYVAEKSHHYPLLLLDDILSELDERAQRFVLDLMKGHQTIITTADQETKRFIVQNAADLEISELDLAQP